MVYTPREDSYLLKRFVSTLDLEGTRVLDMGTGTGIIALEMARQGANVTAADINPEALQMAKKNAESENLENIEFVETDLFEDIEQSFNLITFNPPYLPKKQGQETTEKEWYGGETGSEITSKFIQNSQPYLEQNGAYLTITSNKAQKNLKNHKNTQTIQKKKIFYETLYLISNQTTKHFKENQYKNITKS